MIDSHLLNALVEQIAQRLDRNVVLDDPDHHLLAYCTLTETVDRARYYHLLMKTSVPEVHTRQAEATTHREPFVLPPDPGAGFFGRLGIPLMRHSHHLGTLWVQGQGAQDSLEEPVAQLPSLHAHLTQLISHLHGASLSGPRFPGTSLELATALRRGEEKEAAQMLRSRLVGTHTAIAVVPVFTAAVPTSPAERSAGLARLIAAIGRSITGGFVAGADEDHGICFVSSAPEQREGFVDGLFDIAAAAELDADIGIGAASSDALSESPHVTYQRAVLAAQARAVDPSCSPHWSQVGIYRTLAGLSVTPEDTPYRTELLRDSADGAVLLSTLEAVYDAPGPRAEVARALHLHRATLYNRLARIEQIIGADPLDPAVRLDLHFWMKTLRWARRPRL